MDTIRNEEKTGCKLRILLVHPTVMSSLNEEGLQKHNNIALYLPFLLEEDSHL